MPLLAVYCLTAVSGKRLEPGDPKYVLPIPPKVLKYNPGMVPNER